MAEAELPFGPSKLKIFRAKRHLAELREVLGPYLADNPITWRKFEAWLDDKGRPCVSGESIAKPLPGEVPAILGDIFHNLRSSLDLMATALAEANSKRGDNVHFPFAHDESDIDLMICRKGFAACGEESVHLLRSFAPWTGGNVLLRAIHDLDIMDKHKKLVPLPNIGSLIEIPPAGGLNEDGSIRFGVPKLVDASPSLEFEAGGPLEGRPLFDTLEEMVQLCEGILEAFAPIHQSLKGGGDEGANADGEVPGLVSFTLEGLSIKEVGPAQ